MTTPTDDDEVSEEAEDVGREREEAQIADEEAAEAEIADEEAAGIPAADAEAGGDGSTDDVAGVAETDSATGDSPGPDEHYCSSCGEIIKKRAEICPECGVRQQGVPSGSSGPKDRVTAGILALLLGGIGAHKFYLGETGLGVLYLCFSWTLIPALIGFIEGIIYLTKTDEEFQAAYVN